MLGQLRHAWWAGGPLRYLGPVAPGARGSPDPQMAPPVAAVAGAPGQEGQVAAQPVLALRLQLVRVQLRPAACPGPGCRSRVRRPAGRVVPRRQAEARGGAGAPPSAAAAEDRLGEGRGDRDARRLGVDAQGGHHAHRRGLGAQPGGPAGLEEGAQLAELAGAARRHGQERPRGCKLLHRRGPALSARLLRFHSAWLLRAACAIPRSGGDNTREAGS
mmetsp:Transcript_4460/g.11927  ORF Transcript_4460/g.11927 Transcript_4460/m.11927 type:complete len:217 (-) Transcript_4460:194-844(-)